VDSFGQRNKIEMELLRCLFLAWFFASAYTQTVDVKKECSSLRIALVNGVSFHFEILAGILHVLQPYEDYVEVFMSPWIQKENYDGAWDLVKWSKAKFRKTNMNIESLKLEYHIAILISPDYELKLNQRLLQQMRPLLTLAIVHNSDYKEMDSLLKMAPGDLELLSLSPHVAKSLAESTGRKTDWMLAVYPYKPSIECSGQGGMGECLKGFAMQGKFSNLRRNYSAMWHQIGQHIEDLSSDPKAKSLFKMYILGKGPNRLNLPAEIEQYVSVHRRLPFQGFYDIIARTLALVPSLANQRYFTNKFSSTIITSLSTGTPVIASKRLLEAYSFLSKDSVFSQGDDEEEIDVMLKIVRTTEDEVLKVREGLKSTVQDLNKRSLEKLEGYITRVCKKS
jgi:hypothetical protein